ncbi:tetratricopeptide repeat protein [Cellulophaga sp. HaHaR_3_176]|uniref:tetratricopeptide repeat protein n=1 Tax=Cellulophaga sp. HaHaR_3_176 TaxID=1942464 RepID=UPI001C1F82FB|nr:tetratricopeptide repeat protein [Cellulophaga sp. HaHaR_3_176]QWX83289.1 tetratricopeptide repeat protein [Cellulophaga sp. HaHaR_3_176]
MVRNLLYLFCTSLFCFSITIYSQPSKAANSDDVYIKLNDELKKAIASENFKTIALARFNLGAFCQQKSVYTESINQFNESLYLCKGGKQDSLCISLLNKLGEIHLSLKNYDTAERYFRQGVDEAFDLSDTKKIAYSKSNLGACFEKKGNYIIALEHQKESLLLYEQIADVDGISVVNENIGSIYEDLEQFNLAKKYFEKALSLHVDKQDVRLSSILNNLGDVYRKTGFFDKGLIYTKQSLSVAKQIGDTEREASSYKDLSKNYALLQDFEKSNNALNTFIELDIENRKLQSSNQANALQTIYDTKEKESKIRLLLQNSKVDKAHNNLLLLSIIAVVFLGLAWYLYISKKRRVLKQALEYEKRIVNAELEKKKIEEDSLKKEVDLKNLTLSRYSLHLSQKNKMLSNLSNTLKNSLERTNVDLKRKLNEVIGEIDYNLEQEDEWDEFMSFFKETHPDYIKRITNSALSVLSAAELRLSILLRLNLTSKEIASILRLTPDSVRVSRYRLRKKLPIDSKESLSAFLKSF